MGSAFFFVWDLQTRQIIWLKRNKICYNKLKSKYLHNATCKFNLIIQFPWINTEYDQVSKQYIMQVWKKVGS